MSYKSLIERKPKFRTSVYDALWVIGGILASLTVGFSVIPDTEVPNWLKIALAVYPVLGTYSGYTARTNVNSGDETK